MATDQSSDESLVERDEVFYPKTDMIDAEPLYNNFSAIQNALQKQTNHATHHRSRSSDARYRAVRAHVESSTLRHSQSDDQLSTNSDHSSNTFTVPIDIRSKKIDGHIFNLTQIVENIGYHKNTPFLCLSSDPNTKNVSALLNIVLKAGGAYGPLVNVWRSHISDEYFQRWYLEKYYQRSASLIQYNTNETSTQNARARDFQSNIYMNNFPLPTNQIGNDRHYENEIQKMYGCDDADVTTASTISSHSSSNDMTSYSNQQRSSPITSILKKPNRNNNGNPNSQPKHHVTIVDHYSRDESDQSISSQQLSTANDNLQIQTPPYQPYQNIHADYQQSNNIQSTQQQSNNIQSTYQQSNNIQSIYRQPIDNMLSTYEQTYDNIQSIYEPHYDNIQSVYKQQFDNNTSSYQQQFDNSQSPYDQLMQNSHSDLHIDSNNTNSPILSQYEQVLHTNPDLHNDPNPEIIIKPNPEQPITYEQNITLRYLVPPSPPPHGPLIIREILAPREPTPPPLIVKVQNPSPPTPPPLILREAPPPPPPHQETTVLTKIISSSAPPPARRVIFEHSPPLPPKPQSIIIEKWLPYKPAPPREVIYERITEQPDTPEFEQDAIGGVRQRRHSAEFHYESNRIQIPVEIQRQKSVDHLAREQITEQPSGTFDELVWTTHQQILAMQQRGRDQLQATQQWAANQWQQHANTFLQYPPHLTTPGLVVCHPPTTSNASYVQTEEYRQQRVHYNPSFGYPFY